MTYFGFLSYKKKSAFSTNLGFRQKIEIPVLWEKNYFRKKERTKNRREEEELENEAENFPGKEIRTISSALGIRQRPHLDTRVLRSTSIGQIPLRHTQPV
uniref:Uncharacterized protein n=1 Tax=Cacopsylla melanoneura TaxID=428564 RepID=A0A8D8Q7H6_9HEMI